MTIPRAVFVTGGTGYVGRPLLRALVARHHDVHALVRPGSEANLPPGVHVVRGDALDSSTFAASVPSAATIVHLVGTPHPSPRKATEFTRVDLASIRATMAAAELARARHVVYVSVAQPAPIMQAYIDVRQQGEALIRASGVAATILRPWYVLGPGHYWPYLLVPAYAILRQIPRTRDGAARLGLVTHAAMVASLVRAIETAPDAGVRIVGVPEIRSTPTDLSAACQFRPF